MHLFGGLLVKLLHVDIGLVLLVGTSGDWSKSMRQCRANPPKHLSNIFKKIFTGITE
jgi:hypothetical protein